MNRYYFSYRLSGKDSMGNPIKERLAVSIHQIDATDYEQAEHELMSLYPDRITVHIVEYTVLTDIDALILLEDVNKRIQSTVFREEREFLQSLRKMVEENTEESEIQNWLETIQARTKSDMFSSVHRCSTDLLRQFFSEEKQSA